MNTAVRRLLIFLCVCVTCVSLSAQTTTKKTTPQTSTPQPVSATTDPALANIDMPKSDQAATAPVVADTDKDASDPRAVRLSLDDAIHTTLEKNIGVQLQRYDLGMAGAELSGAYGVYDPIAAATISRSSSQSPATSQFQSSGGSATEVDASIRDTIPTGGSLLLASTNRRSTSTNGGAFFNPVFDAQLGFTFTQPLARNFGVDITQRGITIARDTLGINREAFKVVLLDTTSAVEQAYYDLIYTRRFVDVVKEALFLARDQARITQIRIDVGASAPLDILQPRVQIATSEENLINAVAAVRAAEDNLRVFLNVAPEEWDRPIIPTDAIDYSPMTVNVAEAVARAYQLRPEIKESELNTAIRQVTYQYARNQVLPQFDLNVGYNLSGVAGTPVTTTLGNSTGFSTALQQVFRNDFPGWNVGVTIGVPIFNFAARAEKVRARLDVELSQATEVQSRQNIDIGVRTAARAIDTAAKNIFAAKTAREAAEENVNAERKRYENGMSTNFQVLTIQQQLSDARGSELNALVGYNKAIVAYHRAVGDLLDTRNISIDEPPMQEPTIFNRFNRYNWLNYSSHDNDKEK